MMLRSKVSVELLQRNRSTRLASRSTAVLLLLSAPVLLSLQNRYTNPLLAKFGCSAIPSSPRSEFELTLRSSTGAAWTVPPTTRLTRPLAFSSTSASPGAMNAIETGWLRPEAAVRTPRLGSTTSGACASALPAQANDTPNANSNADCLVRLI
jgi:hypothetical protein